MTLEFNVEDFNPKNHPKYSPNLYKWIKSQKLRYPRIYKDKEGRFWIGLIDKEFPGDLLGCRLAGVLCNGKKERMGWLLGFANQITECTNFWSEYRQDGRCAIDRDHAMAFVGDETRWQQDGDFRRCQWCGQATQRLHRWTETVAREEWRNAREEAQP